MLIQWRLIHTLSSSLTMAKSTAITIGTPLFQMSRSWLWSCHIILNKSQTRASRRKAWSVPMAFKITVKSLLGVAWISQPRIRSFQVAKISRWKSEQWKSLSASSTRSRKRAIHQRLALFSTTQASCPRLETTRPSRQSRRKTPASTSLRCRRIKTCLVAVDQTALKIWIRRTNKSSQPSKRLLKFWPI